MTHPDDIDLTWVDTTWRSHGVVCTLRSRRPVHRDTWELYLIRYHYPHTLPSDPRPWSGEGAWAEHLRQTMFGDRFYWAKHHPGEEILPMLTVDGIGIAMNTPVDLTGAVSRALLDAGIVPVGQLEVRA